MRAFFLLACIMLTSAIHSSVEQQFENQMGPFKKLSNYNQFLSDMSSDVLLQMGMGKGYQGGSTSMKSAAPAIAAHKQFSPFATKGLKFYSMSNAELYGYTFLWIVVFFVSIMVLVCICVCCAFCAGAAAANAENN